MASAEQYRLFSKHVLPDFRLRNLDYPRPDPSGKEGDVKLYGDHFGFTKDRCKRCERSFDATFTNRTECDFHTERSRRYGSKGCRIAPSHVYKGNLYLDLQGYRKTKHRDAPEDGNYGVYALDTESIHTVKGLEVCKVSIIDPKLNVVYNEFCIPTSEIVDYNTIWSGITKNDLEGVTKTFDEMRDEFLDLISADTILVGHGLHHDLISLKIIHDKVVDTVMLYPHNRGLPLRRSLKEIAETVLHQRIQAGEGHDSKEDAEVTMKLALRKI